MIDFWNIEITCPADLCVLHDALLESHAYKWASCVRRMIKEKIFPFRWNKDKEKPNAFYWGGQGDYFQDGENTAKCLIWRIIVREDFLEEDFES